MHTRILRIASRHAPEAGTVCGSSARTDLCGGWQVTAIPTATVDPSARRSYDAMGLGTTFRQLGRTVPFSRSKYNSLNRLNEQLLNFICALAG